MIIAFNECSKKPRFFQKILISLSPAPLTSSTQKKIAKAHAARNEAIVAMYKSSYIVIPKLPPISTYISRQLEE
jgi:hypothetical protein